MSQEAGQKGDDAKSSSEQPKLNISIAIVNTNTNSVKADVTNVVSPNAEVVPEKYAIFRSFFISGWKGFVWFVQNPEWALKWALTILAMKLFLAEGFSLETLKKIPKLGDTDKSNVSAPAPKKTNTITSPIPPTPSSTSPAP